MVAALIESASACACAAAAAAAGVGGGGGADIVLPELAPEVPGSAVEISEKAFGASLNEVLVFDSVVTV